MSTPEFKNLLCTYGAAAFDKQIQLSDLIANRSFQVDLNQRHIEFCGGDSLTIPIRLLGTESDGDSTWLWSWANSASNLPENLVRAAVRLRQIGKNAAISEFVDPKLSVVHGPVGEEIDGHRIAMIASGLEEADTYYRAPYTGGAAFLLLQDPFNLKGKPYSSLSPVPLNTIANRFPQFISAIAVPDHWTAFVSYLKFYRVDHTVEDGQVVARSGKSQLTAEFDELHRLKRIQGKLQSDKELH